MAAALGMEYVHARIFSVYGPNDHPYALIPSCIRTFLAGGIMELSECTQQWNYLHVDDAAEAIVLLAECDLGGKSTALDLAGTDTRPLRDFVEELHRLAGGGGFCAYGAHQSAETPVDLKPDIQHLLELIPWQPRITFAQGVSALIKAERSWNSWVVGADKADC